MTAFVPNIHNVNKDGEYRVWLGDLVERYRRSQIRAAVKVNSEHLLFNWSLGRDLVLRKAEERWGSGIIEQVSIDLRAEFPDDKGFSVSSLWHMKHWYMFYAPKLEQLVRESHQQVAKPQQLLDEAFNDVKIKQLGVAVEDCVSDGIPFPSLFGYIPWGHHIAIISKCASLEEAIFYMRQTIDDGLSRSDLQRIIKDDLFRKTDGAISNFSDSLPEAQARMAQELTKENYDFSFISLPKRYNESQLEEALSRQLTRFLLELGTGFAFVGRQKEIIVSGRTRRIDMLFYHIKLRAYVVCELKAVAFEPEFAGKLNYYVSAVDALIKSKDDNPTIGLLICSDMDKTDVQWAFEGISEPLGVATYNNVQVEDIKKQLPSVEQLKQEIEDLKRKVKQSRQ